jgi:hypothetical protein
MQTRLIVEGRRATDEEVVDRYVLLRDSGNGEPLILVPTLEAARRLNQAVMYLLVYVHNPSMLQIMTRLNITTVKIVAHDIGVRAAKVSVNKSKSKKLGVSTTKKSEKKISRRSKKACLNNGNKISLVILLVGVRLI